MATYTNQAVRYTVTYGDFGAAVDIRLPLEGTVDLADWDAAMTAFADELYANHPLLMSVTRHLEADGEDTNPFWEPPS